MSIQEPLKIQDINLNLSKNEFKNENDSIIARVTIENTGNSAGKEVVQMNAVLIGGNGLNG
jgi:autotransporter translocation and assembly factor TamB